MARRPNGRRVKIHHSYTILAAAEVLGVHKHTVSRWIAAGLPQPKPYVPSSSGAETFERFCTHASPSNSAARPRSSFALAVEAQAAGR